MIGILPGSAEEFQAVRGGEDFDSAVALELNKTYHLDHHQKIGHFDFFVIRLEPASELILELATGAKGINLRQEAPQETEAPYAGITLYNRLRQKISSLSINGSPHADRLLRYNTQEGGEYYLAVGSTFDDMHKDETLFKVSLATRGDLDGEVDAGASLTDALPMQGNRYENNYLGGLDDKDVFSFAAKKGEVYFVGLIPNEESGSSFVVTVYDNYKQKVFSKTSGINEGLKSKEFTIPDDGVYYLEVILGNQLKHPVSYALELNQTGSRPQAPPKATSQPPSQAKPKAKSSPKTSAPPQASPPERSSPPALDDEGPRAMPTPTELPPEPKNPAP